MYTVDIRMRIKKWQYFNVLVGYKSAKPEYFIAEHDTLVTTACLEVEFKKI